MPLFNVNTDLAVKAETDDLAIRCVNSFLKLASDKSEIHFPIVGGTVNTVGGNEMVHQMMRPGAGPMHVEHNAWREVAIQWLGPDINDQKSNALVGAIKVWGEQLVALRISQTPEIRKTAMDQAAESYAKLMGLVE